MSDAFLRLSVSGRNNPLTLTRAEIRQKDNKHTLVMLDTLLPAKSPAAPAEETPATLDWGRADAPDRFYGYVHHTEMISDSVSASRIMRYILIGTSLPMNRVQSRTWKSTTGSAIARQIFTEHRLRAVVTPHSRVLDFWAQSGISDFKTLVNLAEETGFRFWVDGATGYFVDPTVLLAGPRASSVPTFIQNQQAGYLDSLQDLRVLTGTMVPRDGKTVSPTGVYGLDKRSGTLIRATSNTTGAYGQTVSRSVDNYADAQSIVNAQALGSRNWITAEAKVFGSVLAAPGRLVGFNGTALPVDRIGAWFIDGATHIISRNPRERAYDYNTTLSVGRDQNSGVTTRATANLTKNGEVIPATLRDGRVWEATLLEQINVG